MKIGLNLPVMVPGLDRERFVKWCQHIDSGFFSTLASGERVAFYNPDILVALAGAATLTERVKLLTHVALPPMHSPVLLAKRLATIDVLSAGRLIVGVGPGAREQDYQAAGVSFGRRLSKLEQSVAEMRRVWSQETIVEGALPVGPAPVQDGGPEIWAGVLMPKAIKRAAQYADGVCGFSFGPSPTEVRVQYEGARKAWEEAGKPAPKLVMSFWYALGHDAEAQMGAYLDRYLNFMPEAARTSLKPMCTTTSAQALKDAIKAMEDLGTDETVLVPTTVDPDDALRVQDLLA